MTETAAEIIADGQEVTEGSEDEVPSVEEEFRDLQTHVQGLRTRLNKLATTLEHRGNEPATKKDLAQLYRFLDGDVASSMGDLVSACGAAFSDVFEMVENGPEDSEEEGDDEDDNTPSDTDVQVYTTFLANIEAFTNLSNAPGLTEDQKKAFEQMIQLNKGNLAHFEEAYGEETMKQAAAKQVSEAQGGSKAE
jgi:seryl-tRNA synthetase